MEYLANASVRAALGGSLVWEELRGDFTAARAAVDKLAQAEATFERIVVDIVSGRTGAALRALAALGDGTDEPTRVVIRKLIVFANAMHFNHSPTGAGGGFQELMARWNRDVPAYKPGGGSLRAAGDASRYELLLFSALARMQSSRSSASFDVAQDIADSLLKNALDDVRDIAADLEGANPPPCSSTWLALATADIYRRARDRDRALAEIRAERERCTQRHDDHGIAACSLAEGDLLACTFESPLTLGLTVNSSGVTDNAISWQIERLEMARVPGSDLPSVRTAYAAARHLFGEIGAARGLAAVELREAALGALTGAPDVRARADAAESWFLAAGDERNRWLARVHGVLADVARLLPVDASRVEDIGVWGAGDGSLAYAAGLGCVIARAGRRWLLRDAGYEQAIRCARLAEQLFTAAALPTLAAQALGDQVFAHRAIGDRRAAAAAIQGSADRLLEGSQAQPTLYAELVQRAVVLEQQAFQLALAARDPDRMIQAADRLARVGTALRQASDVMKVGIDAAVDLVLRRVIDEVANTAAALAPQYRAGDLEGDPFATDEQRAKAWAEATAVVEQMPEPNRWLYTATLLNDRGDRAGAAEMGAKYFANDPFENMAASLPKELLRQLEPQRIARTQTALTFFVRTRDKVRARAALDKLVSIAGSEWWSTTDDPWLSLYDVADLLRLENSPDAVPTYERAAELLAQKGATLRDDTSKTAFADSASAQRLFVHGARTALSATPPDLSRAFAFAERGKARALADLVSDVRATSSGDDDAIRKWREASARRDLVRGLIAYQRSQQNGEPERVADLGKQLAAVEAEVQDLESKAIAQDPQRFAKLDARAKIASLADVVARMPVGVAAIEYAYVDGTLVGWCVTRAGMQTTICRDIDARLLRRQALQFEHACAHRNLPLVNGEQLAELLLAPFAKEIRAADQLVIIASQDLARVPFHALPFDGDVLVAKLPVTYAPSAGLLAVLAAPRVDGKPLLVVGDPTKMSTDRPDGVVRDLPALPGARLEAEDIGKLVPGADVLIGDTATREAVADALPKHALIQLATHGVVDKVSPWLSSIALANGEQLAVSDLMGIQLAADLVVLSACDTGVGTATHGEEVLSLARGLLAAGAHAAIVSLWKVYDQATWALMLELHRQLKSGTPPAKALQLAQLAIRKLDPAVGATEASKRGVADDLVDQIASTRRGARLADEPPERPNDFRHPAFWAPFILVGV